MRMRAKALYGIGAVLLLGAGFVYGYLAHHNGIHGDLLAIYEGFGIIKLDRDSNLLWSWPRAAGAGG
ncbi:MAG TPA: hypothetical protein VGD06_03625 [Acidobacteriota bacterium]